jgi:ribosomal protein S30
MPQKCLPKQTPKIKIHQNKNKPQSFRSKKDTQEAFIHCGKEKDG